MRNVGHQVWETRPVLDQVLATCVIYKAQVYTYKLMSHVKYRHKNLCQPKKWSWNRTNWFWSHMTCSPVMMSQKSWCFGLKFLSPKNP